MVDLFEPLDRQLARVTIRAAVPPGRESLVRGLFPALLRERAPEGMIVHGPVVTAIDERAERRFALATCTRS